MSDPTFKETTIFKAHTLTNCIREAAASQERYTRELAEIRLLCPWAFDADGQPLPYERPRGGGRLD